MNAAGAITDQGIDSPARWRSTSHFDSKWGIPVPRFAPATEV